MRRIKKAQTALEYIAAALAFSTVGLASFLAINQAAISKVMGEPETYHAPDTVIGKGLADGVSPEEYKSPSTWSQPQPELDGAKPEDTVQLSKEHTSDWDDGKEEDWVEGAPDGEYWADSDLSGSTIDVEPVHDGNYTKEEMQQKFSDYTQQWINENSEGYTAERKQEINEDADQSWFIPSDGSGEGE